MSERINRSESLSSRTAHGISTAIMGLPFIGVGGYYLLISPEAAPTPDGELTPMWVIRCCGLAIAASGLLVFFCGLRGAYNARRTRRVQGLHPDKPWLADYPWKPFGIKDKPFLKLASFVIGGLFLGILAAPFHWWAFEKDVVIIKGLVIATDGLLMIGVLRALLGMIRTFRFGRSQLHFAEFPFFLGQKALMRFSPNRFDSLHVSLSHIEESFELQGKGRSARQILVHRRHYEVSKTIECSKVEPTVDIEFDLPDRPEWATRLCESPCRYWELTLHARCGGIELRTSFLIPVYASCTVTPKKTRNAPTIEPMRKVPKRAAVVTHPVPSLSRP